MSMSKFIRRRRKIAPTYRPVPCKSVSEIIPIIYYISLIVKDTKEITEDVIDAVSTYICDLNLTEEASDLLTIAKKNLEKKNSLKLLKDGKDYSTERIADTDIPLKYEIDKYLNANYSFSPRFSNLQVDLYRVCMASEEPIMNEFLARLFLCEDKEDSKEMKLTAKAKREISSTKKVQFLINKAGLSKEEALCVLIKYRLNYNSELYRIAKDYDVDQDMFIASALNMTTNQYRKMLKPENKLKSYGFLDEDGEISEDIVDCIINNSLDPYFSEYLKPIDCSSSFPLDSFSVPQETTDIIENLLVHQDSSSILLYGKPGSGKTEYAKAIAKKTGYKTYIFKNENEVMSGINSIGRLNCYLSIKQKDTIVIVDEADKILQTITYSMFGATPSPTKGTINQMLENNQNKIIWIINHTRQIDESTKRRFTMSYKFDNMSVNMLRSITKAKLAPLGLSNKVEEGVLSLFDQYSVTGASVNNIVKTISAFQSTDTNDDVLLSSVKTVIQENSKLLDSRTSKIRETVSNAYNPSIINASVDPDKIVKMVKNAQKFSEENNTSENGIRMLFYGISGSGKTELVRYIAQELGKKILIKRPSDIMGKFVGDNETNIKEAFEQAAQEDMILLFDEADSFFANRNLTDKSWERNTTNEFLTQMEEFPGILICTTNLKNIMDKAMERRFHIMVEFKPLEKDGIKLLLNNYFGKYDFTSSEINELYDYGTVTPGDFGALSSRIRFMDSSDISSSYIVNELGKLQEDKDYDGGHHKHHCVGFQTY